MSLSAQVYLQINAGLTKTFLLFFSFNKNKIINTSRTDKGECAFVKVPGSSTLAMTMHQPWVRRWVVV